MGYRLYAAAIAVCMLAGPALSCEGKTVVFEDKFQDDLGGWDPAPVVRIENGALVLRLPNNRGAQGELNVAFLAPTDLDVCAELIFPTESPEAGAISGLIFWAVDYSNLYVAQLSMKGSAALFTRTDGKWWGSSPNPARAGSLEPSSGACQGQFSIGFRQRKKDQGHSGPGTHRSDPLRVLCGTRAAGRDTGVRV